jgi:hypothetical protein
VSDQTPAPEQAPQTQTPPAEPAPSGPPEWLGPIEERMNELRDQMAEQNEQFSTLMAPPEEEEPEFEIYDDEGDLTPEAAQAIIDQRVNQALEQRWSEHQATEALNLRNIAYEELKERIPALQDDRVVGPIVQDVAESLREAGYEGVIETPKFVELIEQAYKAQLYDEHAASASPAPSIVLESGAGAAPQRKEDEVDWGERIVKAAERLSPKI